MSSHTHNDNGTNGFTFLPAASPTTASGTKFGDTQESQVVFQNSNGVELRGAVLRLEQFRVVFETYQAGHTLKASQVFESFKVCVEGNLIYSGRAVICNFLNLGTVSACEVKLDGAGVAVVMKATADRRSNVAETYRMFFNRWQKQSKVLPEFKAVVSDLQSYLSGLKIFLEQVEISIGSGQPADQLKNELQVAQDLAPSVLASIDTLRERLLEVAARVAPEHRPAHESIIRRQLHPLFLCAPFAFRTYQKPLGYAGDYEMMNMIHRNTFEGETLFAKLVHYWLVNQYPAISVRNRIAHMQAKLVQETVRRVQQKKTARILNVGCGPAREVQQFISNYPFADQAEFTLIDFDSETLNYVNRALHEAKNKHDRKTAIELVQMSVTKLLKGSAGRAYPVLAKQFDLIYCGGLFDYFPDETCKQFVEMFYRQLAPGGLVVVANMDDRVPFKHMQEYLLDWHLIYRDNQRMAALVPDNAQPSDWKVIAEQVAVNLFLEVRKPDCN